MPVLQTSLLDQVYRLLAPQDSDAELLGSFTARRDEAAFAALVRRHGPMVLRLCRRLLGEAHAAEDCFQATFMALACQAGSIRRPAAVAAWLYGVAYRVSLKTRAERGRRRAVASAVDVATCPDPRPEPLDRLSGRELIDAFEEEMQRLPESYRLPIALCCLEGLSQEEAARRLGWTPGAVKGRLERGRTRLHARLVRRGLTLSIALTAVEAARGLATATLPATLASATVKAALAFVRGSSVFAAEVPAEAARLATEIVHGAGLIRRTLALVLVLGIGIMAVGAAALSRPAAVDPAPPDGKQAAPNDKPETLTGKPEARVDRLGDALPPGALFRIGTTRLQHGAYVRAAAASPDGKLLASVSDDRSLSLWDVQTGREIYRRPVGDSRSGFFSFTPDAKSLFFHKDRMLCLLDIDSGKVSKQLGGFAYAGVLSPDGKILAVVQSDGGDWSPMIRRLDLATGKALSEWKYRPEPPPGARGGLGVNFSVASWLSADGKNLATVESDFANQKQTLRLHDVATGKELRRWQVPAPHVRDVVFTSNGKFLITGSGNSTLRVWEIATAKEVRRWKPDPRDNVEYGSLDVTLMPDGESVLSQGPGGLIRWDWRTGKKIHSYPDTRGPIAFLNGGKAMAVQGSVSVYSLWVLDTTTGKDLCPLGRPGHRVAFSPDGRLVAWAEGGSLVLADAATGKEVRRWLAHQGGAGPLTFAPDGRTLASAGGDKHIRLWDVNTAKEIRSMPHAGVSWLVISADGKRLASVVGWHAEACVWDPATGKQLGKWQGDLLTTLDPGARVVAVADRKAKVLRLADLATGKALHALPGYQERIGHRYQTKSGGSGSHGDFPPLFSPHGRLLLAGAEVPDDADTIVGGFKDGAVYFWDVASGKRLAPILDGKKFVFPNIAFSPDSRLLAITRSDCMMCLMDAATGDVVRTLGAAEGPMTAPPVFTPDGRLLVTAVHGLIQVWEVATGGEIARRQGHRGDIDGLVVSGDGRCVATVARDHTILVWDLTRLVPGERPRAPLTAAELDAAWGELASPNAANGRHAIELLTAVPAQALALVQKRLPPAPVPDGKQVARWLNDLGSDNFKQRERAAEELGRLGEVVGPALRKALAANPPLEARRRLEDLQKKLNPAILPPGTLQVVRAVQVLEALASHEAQGVLQELSRGAPGVRVTDEAAATLRRLEARARSKRSPAR